MATPKIAQLSSSLAQAPVAPLVILSSYRHDKVGTALFSISGPVSIVELSHDEALFGAIAQILASTVAIVVVVTR